MSEIGCRVDTEYTLRDPPATDARNFVNVGAEEMPPRLPNHSNDDEKALAIIAPAATTMTTMQANDNTLAARFN